MKKPGGVLSLLLALAFILPACTDRPAGGEVQTPTGRAPAAEPGSTAAPEATPASRVEPVSPTEPLSPTDPLSPTEPLSPSEPLSPTEPASPPEPLSPTEPMSPARPEPAEPTARASQAPGAGVRGVDADIQVTPEQAYDLFKNLYPTAQVKQLELDLQDHAYYAYEVEGYEGNTEYEIKIDALDARILKQEQGRHDGSGGEILRADLARIPELIAAALQGAGAGFRVKDWEAVVKRDRVVFEVELLGQDGREIEYQFDLQTGDLLQKDV